MKISEMSAELLRTSGTDLDVVNAARVSFHKESEWEYPDDGPNLNQPVLQTKDAKLINYLAKHNHWTPFAHVGATFRVKAPIFVARQLGKHQVGLVWNEVSRRYVDEEPEFWFPKEWRGRPVNAKQGSNGVLENQDYWHILARQANNDPYSVYMEAISCGMSPEQARMILPQNTMTEWVWTGSLAAWARVAKLRLDEHTQQETSDLVKTMVEPLVQAFPVSFKALMEN